jgi:hypothetical protein
MIRTLELPDEVLAMIERGAIADGKTLVSLLFVQSFRR